jgi:hypothetical protein
MRVMVKQKPFQDRLLDDAVDLERASPPDRYSVR